MVRAWVDVGLGGSVHVNYGVVVLLCRDLSGITWRFLLKYYLVYLTIAICKYCTLQMSNHIANYYPQLPVYNLLITIWLIHKHQFTLCITFILIHNYLWIDCTIINTKYPQPYVYNLWITFKTIHRQCNQILSFYYTLLLHHTKVFRTPNYYLIQ